jgi:zinc/manganese transport system ATP-binding protein
VAGQATEGPRGRARKGNRILTAALSPVDNDAVQPIRKRDTPRGPVVSSRHAAVSLGGRIVWSDVTFDIQPGEFVAVLGPNGTGKSTLLKALLGLVPLSAGELRVSGTAPRHGNVDVGYLPQRRSFDASARVRGVDVVRLGLDGDRWGMPLPGVLGKRGRLAAQRVGELIELVEASTYADRPIGSLSGGEQQRLLIAQALARRPSLLLLDEPLDSLDVANQSAIATLLARISRSESVTVVIVAHDVNPILSYLDLVIYLARGHAASGAPSDVITSATLSRLYGTPIEVLYTSDGLPVVVGHGDATSYHPGLHTGHEPHLHG